MTMYLKKVKKKQTGRIYLSIVQSYRDNNSKFPKSTTIKSLGYLDDLEKEYDDPIAYFTEEVNRMNKQNANDNSAITFSIGKGERISTDSANRRNFGYAALSKIYHGLEIDTFLVNRQRHTKEDFDANAIMKLLVFSRLLYPVSKKKYTLSAGNGYVLSYSIRSADQNFKDYVLDEKEYIEKGNDFKIKSWLYPREITVTTTRGKKMKKSVDEKQVIFYSTKYAQKAKHERAAALQKARDLI